MNLQIARLAIVSQNKGFYIATNSSSSGHGFRLRTGLRMYAQTDKGIIQVRVSSRMTDFVIRVYLDLKVASYIITFGIT